MKGIILLETKIKQLEEKLNQSNKELTTLKARYNENLKEGLTKLNKACYQAQKETDEYKELNKEVAQTYVNVDFGDYLLENIKHSKEFKDVVESYHRGELKAMSLSYNIEKLKKITQDLENVPHVGWTKPIDSGIKNKEERERVEKRMEGLEKTEVNDTLGVKAYTFQDPSSTPRGKKGGIIFDQN